MCWPSVRVPSGMHGIIRVSSSRSEVDEMKVFFCSRDAGALGRRVSLETIVGLSPLARRGEVAEDGLEREFGHDIWS